MRTAIRFVEDAAKAFLKPGTWIGALLWIMSPVMGFVFLIGLAIKDSWEDRQEPITAERVDVSWLNRTDSVPR